jgi:hypothetical protein
VENPSSRASTPRARDDRLNIEALGTLLEAHVVIEARARGVQHLPSTLVLSAGSVPADYAERWTINQPARPMTAVPLRGAPQSGDKGMAETFFTLSDGSPRAIVGIRRRSDGTVETFDEAIPELTSLRVV